MNVQGFPTGPVTENCFLLSNETTGEAIVVDPGMGAFEKVQEIAAEQNLTVVAVILTHGHVDHIRDAAEFGVETFIHPEDEFMLDGSAEKMEKIRTAFDIDSMRVPDNVTHVSDGTELTLAGEMFTVVHAPGHSPGSTLWVHKEFVATGDVLFRSAIGRTDFPYCDPDVMQETLRGPIWDLEDHLTVLPGHGPTTTVKLERETNQDLRAAHEAR